MAYVLPNVQITDLITGTNEVSYRASVRLSSGDSTWTGSATASFSTPTLTISNLAAGATNALIDSVEVAVGDRILIKNNTSDSNAPAGLWGIWNVITTPDTTSVTLERAEDMLAGSNALTIHTIVREGTAGANAGWLQSNNVTIDNSTVLAYKNITAGTGSAVAALPISGGGTGATTFTDKQIVKYDATTNKLISTTTARIDTILDPNIGTDTVVADFDGVASAVNNLVLTNAVTTASPVISAAGTDTNIGLNLQTKGTGAVSLLGTSAAQARLRLFEQTTNGTNSIGIQSPASLAADYTLTLPADDGTSGQMLVTDGAGVLSWASSSNFLPLSIATIQINATSTTATAVAYMAWFQAAYGSGGTRAISTTPGNSKLRIYAVIGNRNLTIRAGFSTNSDVLTAQTITSTGTYEYSLTGLPTANSRIAFYVNKSAVGGTDPQIFGITVDFSLA